jgi:hypothetical protein
MTDQDKELPPDISADVNKLIDSLKFAAPELWSLHILRYTDDVLAAIRPSWVRHAENVRVKLEQQWAELRTMTRAKAYALVEREVRELQAEISFGGRVWFVTHKVESVGSETLLGVVDAVRSAPAMAIVGAVNVDADGREVDHG